MRHRDMVPTILRKALSQSVQAMMSDLQASAQLHQSACRGISRLQCSECLREE